MERKFVIGTGIYMVIAAIRFSYLEKSRLLRAGERCLADHLCDISYYGYGMLYPFLLILMIGFLGNFFRTAVILRYRRVWVIIRSMLIRCFNFSVFFGVLQTCMAVFTGLRMTEYTTNWNQWNSYAAISYGITVEKPIPAIVLIALYLYLTVIHIFIMACIICMLWYLTEKPIAGFIVVLIVLAYESTTGGRGIFFKVISMEEGRLIFDTPGMGELVIYPFVLTVICVAAMRLIICNKDFVRLT